MCRLNEADGGAGVIAQGRDFKGRWFTAAVILWAVRWYLMFPISYRDLELMLQDRGVEVDHTTLFRWIQAYAPELEKRIRPHLRSCNGSWRVDETYVKVKGRWTYLYRAVDSRGQTIDFLLSAKRDAAAAKRFFRKALGQPHTVNPRTITVDKNGAYPAAVTAMKRDGELWRFSRLRPLKYLNNIVDQDRTLIAVIEMSQSNWLVAGLVPGIERQPLKKLSPDEDELLKLVHRWRNEAAQAGRVIKRIVVAYEAGRDGFWLARWLRRRGIEAYVIHPSSVAVSREHRRAKTDRLDTELLMRAFLGWLRGEKRHCSMAAIPTIEDEDAKRPSREHEKLVGDRTRLVNRMKAMLARFGIRTFKPTLRKAEERLAGLCTAEGTPLPENTRAELRRDTRARSCAAI